MREGILLFSVKSTQVKLLLLPSVFPSVFGSQVFLPPPPLALPSMWAVSEAALAGRRRRRRLEEGEAPMP